MVKLNLNYTVEITNLAFIIAPRVFARKSSINLWQKVLVTILLISTLSYANTVPTNIGESKHLQSTSQFYEGMLNSKKPNEALLHLFFTKMPKGGDIHHHYSGSIYAETYLEWVDKKGWMIDSCSLLIIKESKDATCKLLTAQELIADDTLYRRLLTLWSDKDYSNHSHNQPPPDSNFFNTFLYIETIAYEYINLGLNILKKRAIKENLNYIETMLSMVGINSSNYYDTPTAQSYNKQLRAAKSQEQIDSILDEIVTTYNKSSEFNATVDSYVAKLNRDHQGIDDANFMMRYQTYAVRVFEPLQVFSDLYASYMTALKSPLIVGVNIVAPENNTVALSDYTLHMRMYNYLAQRYPTVHRALHAGELTLGMVRPKNLLFHIREAREIAQAQRIGHGVDISYEEHPIKLLKDLKENAAIEINFSSNEFILGVKGDKHPYLIYERYNVPLVIATDDSGVTRNNLTQEYMKLATRYHPSYQRIKEYVYNSIKYSFLEQSEKELLTKDLDRRFISFEREMAEFSQGLGAKQK